MKRFDHAKQTRARRSAPVAPTPAPPRPDVRRPPAGLVAPALPVLLAALALLQVTAAGCGGGRGTDAPPPPPTVRAELATAERVELPRRIEVVGTVEAERTAAVATRVTAMVTAVHAQAGDRVGRGELLVEIDPATTAGQLAQARGGLGQARAAYALAERNFERYRALAAIDAASELELDSARS